MNPKSLPVLAAEYIKLRCPDFTPEIGIVLGSGLGKLVEHIENPTIISYGDIPGFIHCSVEGHEGHLYLGTIAGVPVACMQGRLHLYEGVEVQYLKNHIRTLKCLGCELMLATNAAGSFVDHAKPGSLMIIRDHINLLFSNPLVGPNDDEFGPRFVDMDNAYNKELRNQMKETAQNLDIALPEAVYIGVLGPCFETPAEILAFQTLGAEAIGMSTVPDVIIARHCDLKVIVISVITNAAVGLSDEKIDHDVTLSMAEKASGQLIKLVCQFIENRKK